jgi:hypothetical protein
MKAVGAGIEADVGEAPPLEGVPPSTLGGIRHVGREVPRHSMSPEELRADKLEAGTGRDELSRLYNSNPLATERHAKTAVSGAGGSGHIVFCSCSYLFPARGGSGWARAALWVFNHPPPLAPPGHRPGELRARHRCSKIFDDKRRADHRVPRRAALLSLLRASRPDSPMALLGRHSRHRGTPRFYFPLRRGPDGHRARRCIRIFLPWAHRRGAAAPSPSSWRRCCSSVLPDKSPRSQAQGGRSLPPSSWNAATSKDRLLEM